MYHLYATIHGVNHAVNLLSRTEQHFQGKRGFF
jgi:hypothetical protein